MLGAEYLRVQYMILLVLSVKYMRVQYMILPMLGAEYMCVQFTVLLVLSVEYLRVQYTILSTFMRVFIVHNKTFCKEQNQTQDIAHGNAHSKYKNQTLWYRSVISLSLETKDHKFKICLDFRVRSRISWAT